MSRPLDFLSTHSPSQSSNLPKPQRRDSEVAAVLRSNNLEEPAWTWTLHTRIPSTKEAGHQLIERLLEALTEAAWDGSDFFHVQMAAEEAMVNAVTHGNKESEELEVEVEFKVATQRVFLRFCDQGDGFNPDGLPDPTDDEHLDKTHGRGVFLIKQMMNEVNYNECGNEVTMLKHRETESTVK
jgi:serine/threonine-protein kinase RsbW